ERAQSRTRVGGDGESIGKRVSLRWPAKGRDQGRPHAGGVPRKPSSLTMPRWYRPPIDEGQNVGWLTMVNSLSCNLALPGRPRTPFHQLHRHHAFPTSRPPP